MRVRLHTSTSLRRGAYAAFVVALAIGCIPSEPQPHEAVPPASPESDASVRDSGPLPPPGDAGGDAGGETDTVPALPSCGALDRCGNNCVRLKTDPSNCGDCDHACAPNVICSEGQCRDHVVEVSAGGDIGCARYAGGDVWCWGWNQYGQAGTPPLGTDPQWNDGSGVLWRYHAPVRVHGLTQARQISLGLRFACAVKETGAVACWGHNQAGQLGHDNAADARCPTASVMDAGAAGSSEPCGAAPLDVVGIAEPALEVRAGTDHACARTASHVYCWGANWRGQLGRPASEVRESASPLAVPGLGADVVGIGVGYYDSCAVLANGTVKCWGETSVGQLGRPATNEDETCAYHGPCSPSPKPVLINDATPLDGAVQVVGGRAHGCVLKADASVWCWGNQKYGALGNDTFGGAQWWPSRVAALPQRGVRLAAGNYTQAVVDERGVAWLWGLNTLGALGSGALDGTACDDQSSCRTHPAELTAPGLGPIAGIALGLDASYAVDTTGVVWAWGAIGYGGMGRAPGELGDRTDCSFPEYPINECNPTPRPLKGLPNSPP